MDVPGFVGGSAQSVSRSLDVERTINLISLRGDSGTPRVKDAMRNAPGVRPWVTLPVGPVRGLYTLNGQRLWAVAGATLYEVFGNQTAMAVGSVTQDSRPATFACNGANGNQLLVCSGFAGYVLDLVTGAFAVVPPDPASGFPAQCAMVAECAGYALALGSQVNQVNFSAPEDFSSWDTLDFFRVQTNDPLVSMISANRLVYVFGGQQSQVWYPDGSASVFGPVQNVQIESGTSSPFGPVAVGVSPTATVLFPNRSSNGQGVMYGLDGYSPQPVSSFAISTILQQQSRLDDMVSWTYQEDGHTFALFYIPTNDTTLCFDASAGAGMNWTERAIWDSHAYRWLPHIGRCHAFAFGKHLVGSRADGTIYEMSNSLYLDAIVP